MPVAEEPQHLQALTRGNELRLRRGEERRALRESTAEQIERALLAPSDALATYTLSQLFAPTRTGYGLLPRFGKKLLERVLWQLIAWSPKGRAWDSTVKLGDLTEGERRRLVEALQPYLPKDDRS